jgi:hypothetical protein
MTTTIETTDAPAGTFLAVFTLYQKGMIVTPRIERVIACASGYVRGGDLAINGARLRVVSVGENGTVQAELLPRDKNNGPVYTHCPASDLEPI